MIIPLTAHHLLKEKQAEIYKREGYQIDYHPATTRGFSKIYFISHVVLFYFLFVLQWGHINDPKIGRKRPIVDSITCIYPQLLLHIANPCNYTPPEVFVLKWTMASFVDGPVCETSRPYYE